MTGRSRMAMSSDFLEACARLLRAQQKGVRSLIFRFDSDPTASGMNYERVRAARDPAMRSLRLDQGWVIVLKPERGDVHLLLGADKHDEACVWAGRHERLTRPETGALRVYAPRTDLPGGIQDRDIEGGSRPGRKDGRSAAAFGRSADASGSSGSPSATRGPPADAPGRPPATPGRWPDAAAPT